MLSVICLNRPEFGSIFDIADRKRADAERAALAERRSVGVRIHAFDARRRHRVDVGRDQQFRGACDLGGVEHAHARFRCAQHDFRRRENRLPLLRRRAVGDDNVDAEPAIDLSGVARGALRSVAPDEGDGGALERGDDARGGSHHAGRAEDRDGGAAKRAILLLPQRLFDDRDHRGRGGERAGRVGEQRNLERLEQRLAGGVEHVESEKRVLAANEDARPRRVARRAREHGVLDQVCYLVERNMGVGSRRVIAGVERHIDIEGAHVRERRHHVQDVLGHCSSQAIIGLRRPLPRGFRRRDAARCRF